MPATHGKSQLMGCLLSSSRTVYSGAAYLYSSTTGTRIASDSFLAPTYHGSAFCSLTRQSQESSVSCMQAQQEVHLAGAAGNSPLQVPLAIEEPQAIQTSSVSASYGNASSLMQEAAEAVHQVPHVHASNTAHHDIAQSHIFILAWTKAFLVVLVGQGWVTGDATLCRLLMHHRHCIFCPAAAICLSLLAQLSLSQACQTAGHDRWLSNLMSHDYFCLYADSGYICEH